jgi:hypothetical protein
MTMCKFPWYQQRSCDRHSIENIRLNSRDHQLALQESSEVTRSEIAKLDEGINPATTALIDEVSSGVHLVVRKFARAAQKAFQRVH